MLGDVDGTALAVWLGSFAVLGLVSYGIAARAYAGVTTPD